MHEHLPIILIVISCREERKGGPTAASGESRVAALFLQEDQREIIDDELPQFQVSMGLCSVGEQQPGQRAEFQRSGHQPGHAVPRMNPWKVLSIKAGVKGEARGQHSPGEGQTSSSEPSAQSRYPSHTQLSITQAPLLQR